MKSLDELKEIREKMQAKVALRTDEREKFSISVIL